MGLEDLPLDLWRSIIEIGNLGITDVLRLLRVSPQLNHLLKHNSIWYRLVYDKYLKILVQYECPETRELVQNRSSGNYGFYELTLNFIKKELRFKKSVENSTVIDFFIDNYIADNDYLPIAYNLYHGCKTYIEMLEENDEENDEQIAIGIWWVKRSKVLNVLIAQSYKLGFNYFNQLIKKHKVSPGYTLSGVTSLSDFESFWFKVSLIDKSSHIHIFSRQRVLDKIFKTLDEEIKVKRFFDIESNIKYIPSRNLGQLPTLEFQNKKCLIQLVIQVIDLVLGCLHFTNQLVSKDPEALKKYEDSFFLEDFNILRLYGGEVKGHPFLIMSVLMKILNEFLLSKYQIEFVNSDQIDDNPLTMTSAYLKFDEYLFSFDRTNLYNRNFQVHTIDEVISTSRSRGYRTTILRPVNLHSHVESYLTIDEANFKPLNTILRPACFSTSMAIEVLANSNCYFMSYDEFLFIRLVCRYVRGCRVSNQDFCKELEESLNVLNNFIHFNTVYYLFEGDPTQEDIKKYFLKDPSAVNSLFRSNFNLWHYTFSFDKNPAPSISFDRIKSKYPFGAFKVYNYDYFRGGEAIRHKKSQIYGIILGPTDKEKYFRVYTTKKTIECYHEDSMDWMYHWHRFAIPQVMNFIIRSCGEDVLGLLFFGGLVRDYGEVRFIPPNEIYRYRDHLSAANI